MNTPNIMDMGIIAMVPIVPLLWLMGPVKGLLAGLVVIAAGLALWGGAIAFTAI